MGGDGAAVARGFDRSAAEYDELLVRNRHGARRLVDALPEEDHPRVLDVGCGTGFVSEEMVARRGALDLTGVDPSEAMLARYAEKLGAQPGVVVRTLRAGVLDMAVPEGAFDAVVSGMAFHWFPDKPAAIAAMARALRPGGALGVLAAGRGTDEEFMRILRGLDPPVPAAWTEVTDHIHRDCEELREMIEAAGLEPLDVWEERRRRRADPDAFLARIQAVAGHLSDGLDPDEAAAHGERVTAAVRAAAGPRGFEYTFVKLYGVARRPS